MVMLFFFFFFHFRYAIIQNYLREMREAHISILERFQILFSLLPLVNWKTFSTLVVEILLYMR